MSNWFTRFTGCCGWNTNRVCGQFEKPVNPDLGRCHPYRVKIDCEAPEIPPDPPSSCGEAGQIIYDPNRTPPFYIVSYLYDESCNLITDESGNPIQTEINQ